MNLSKNIVRQYNTVGLINALQKELLPITERAQRGDLKRDDAYLIANEVKQSALAIDSLLACLEKLSTKQLNDLLKMDKGDD